MKKKEELLEILREKYIYPVFQPIVSLRDGKILGYEALSRIDTKTSIKNIEEFFQLGVMYGKTWEIEKLCRKKILQAYAGFPEKSKKGKLFINVNPLVMQDEKFKQNYTKKQLQKRDINTNKIVIEVTERNTIDNLQEFKEIINHYKKQEYEIAIDDVGSCYSGLNVIANLSPHYLKIDMALIRGIDKDPMRQAIVRGLVEMSNHASFELVAEGIETEEELKILMMLGVSYGQGYFIGKPNRDLVPINKNAQKAILESDNNESKKVIWNGKKYALCQVSINDYKSIDAYSEKYGEDSLKEVFHTLFDIVRGTLNVFEAMYILDENSCVVILENKRFDEISQLILQQFRKEIGRFYSNRELNNEYIEIKSKKGNIKERPLMSVSVELIG